MADESDTVVGIYSACGSCSERERLQLLETTWLIVASRARNEALIVPGGFVAERDRQLNQLRKMADVVATDVPNLEMERLFLKGDFEGMRRHYLSRLNDADDPAKGGV